MPRKNLRQARVPPDLDEAIDNYQQATGVEASEAVRRSLMDHMTDLGFYPPPDSDGPPRPGLGSSVVARNVFGRVGWAFALATIVGIIGIYSGTANSPLIVFWTIAFAVMAAFVHVLMFTALPEMIDHGLIVNAPELYHRLRVVMIGR